MPIIWSYPRSGVIRISSSSRRPWRMISWPAANGIRWVKPSSATESPSLTSSATASWSDISCAIESPTLVRHVNRRSHAELYQGSWGLSGDRCDRPVARRGESQGELRAEQGEQHQQWRGPRAAQGGQGANGERTQGADG